MPKTVPFCWTSPSILLSWLFHLKAFMFCVRQNLITLTIPIFCVGFAVAAAGVGISRSSRPHKIPFCFGAVPLVVSAEVLLWPSLKSWICVRICTDANPCVIIRHLSRSIFPTRSVSCCGLASPCHLCPETFLECSHKEATSGSCFVLKEQNVAGCLI